MSATVPDARATVSVAEAARLLGVGRGLAYEGVRRGEIPSIRIGRRLVVPRAGLDRLLSGEAAVGPTSDAQPAGKSRPAGG